MTSDEFSDIERLDENLRKWFKEKWVRFGPDGKIRGACARGDDSEGKPKCLPQKKAQNLGKKGRKYAASKKRREDPNPERTGKAKNVATKKKTNEGVPFNECPKCRGPIVHESMMNEKQDACYHKVKSRYKVWPSAYASGALVQCRKKGASNWGTGGKKKNESSIMKGIVDEAEASKLVQISKPVTQDPIDDPWMGINVITKYKVGDKVYSVLSVKELEQEDVYGTYIFDNTDPKNHMDDVAQIDIYGNRAIFNKNHTGAPKGVWYQLPENIAMALHNASFPEAKKLLDAQPMPDEDGLQEAKAKQYVKPFVQDGKQVGWKSSDGYHVKYWQMFAKDSAIKHAKLNPNEVQEDYTGQFAAEKTPAINPYGGLKDNKFRGAISEEPTDNPTGASGEGGWRKYKPKPAGELDESRMHQYNINDAVKKVQEYHRTQGSPYRGAATRLLNALYQWQNTEDDNIVTRAQLLRTPNMGKQAMALLDTLLGNISKDESPYDQNKNQAIVIVDSLKQALAGDDLQSILDLMRELKNAIGNMDRLSYKRVREDTAYAGGMGQGGNAGESYRKFTPKSAGTFKEDELDEACWKGYHKEGNKKMFGKTYPNCVKNTNEEEQLDEKCWDSHKQVGMKNKGGKQVPNCVPKESAIMKGLKR